MIRITDAPVVPRGEPSPTLTIGEPETDPVLVAQLREVFDRAAANAAWYEAHAEDIRSKYPGKYIRVAAGELFVGDDPQELAARVRAARPDDWSGAFRTFVPPHGPG